MCNRLTLKVLLKTLMVRHGGSSAGSYLTDPTSPIPSHCASIVVTSTLRVNTELLITKYKKKTTYGLSFSVLLLKISNKMFYRIRNVADILNASIFFLSTFSGHSVLQGYLAKLMMCCMSSCCLQSFCSCPFLSYISNVADTLHVTVHSFYPGHIIIVLGLLQGHVIIFLGLSAFDNSA